MSMHTGFLILSLAALTGVAIWVWLDYRAWLSLGPGGLPSTPKGWIRMTQLRLMAKNPFDLSCLKAAQGNEWDRQGLITLPTRHGDRPRVGIHPVPHRQLSGQADAATKAELGQMFEGRVADAPEILDYRLSHFEKNNKAVSVHEPLCCHPDAMAGHGETAHIHPSDGSMHMILSPSDAVTAIERGWGELHVCAGQAMSLPASYTLIYAPRDSQDVAHIATILDAAIDYIAGATVRPVTN